jgi:hypothetical protein
MPLDPTPARSSLEVSRRVTNGIPLGCPLFLPVHTVNCIQTLKVPSISADDADYLVAGGTSGVYWRGETWAPQAYLVFLGLQRYDHLPVVRAARKGLCVQQLALLLTTWKAHHHVCTVLSRQPLSTCIAC